MARGGIGAEVPASKESLGGFLLRRIRSDRRPADPPVREQQPEAEAGEPAGSTTSAG